MNQIRHDQIRQTGDLNVTSSFWTTGSTASEDQYLPNARAIEDRIEYIVAENLVITSGSVIEPAGNSVIGNITKEGNRILVTKVSLPTIGSPVYQTAAFRQIEDWDGTVSPNLVSSYMNSSGIVQADGEWLSCWIRDPEGNQVTIREGVSLLFINGISQPYGPENYEIVPVSEEEGFSRMYINVNILHEGDNLYLLYLSTQPVVCKIEFGTF